MTRDLAGLIRKIRWRATRRVFPMRRGPIENVAPSAFHADNAFFLGARRTLSVVVALALLSGGAAADAARRPAPDEVTTVPTGPMRSARSRHTATLLENGKVLVAGGFGLDPESGGKYGPLSSAELYDPATGTFAPTGAMGSVAGAHTATLLLDGRVLVIGGSSAERYDPATGKFSPAGTLNASREEGHTATRLRDGKVLVVGGRRDHGDESGTAARSSELFDPAKGTFSPAGATLFGRVRHSATLLADGTVLVAGGVRTAAVWLAPFTAERFDPATERFTQVAGLMAAMRWDHAATRLPDGTVLLSGGGYASRQERYDPSTQTFSRTGAFGNAGTDFTTTLLPDGRLLFSGGSYYGSLTNGQLSAVMIFDPSKGESVHAGRLGSVNAGHAATLLPDGKLLFTGGIGAGRGARTLASAELLDLRKMTASDGPLRPFEPAGEREPMAQERKADFCRDERLLARIGHEQCRSEPILFERDGKKEPATVASAFLENRIGIGGIFRVESRFLRTSQGEILELGAFVVPKESAVSRIHDRLGYGGNETGWGPEEWRSERAGSSARENSFYFEELVEREGERNCFVHRMKPPYSGEIRQCAGDREIRGTVGYLPGIVTAQEANRKVCERIAVEREQPCEHNSIMILSNRPERDARGRMYYKIESRRRIRDYPERTERTPYGSSTPVAYEEGSYRVDAEDGRMERIRDGKRTR